MIKVSLAVSAASLLGGGCADFSYCPEPDDATIAAYRFDGQDQQIHPAAGAARLTGTLGAAVRRGAGPCGGALSFPAVSSSGSISTGYETTGAFAVLAADAAWAIDRGAIELWLRLDEPVADGVYGILSRDASGSAAEGHFSLFRMVDSGVNALAVRLQSARYSRLLCPTGAVSAGVWHHLAINLGGSAPTEVYLDGVQLEPRAGALFGYPCGPATAQSLVGNGEPWVLGALSWASEPDQSTPATSSFNGAIAALRFSSRRRNFEIEP